jgi:hypothetical protein
MRIRPLLHKELDHSGHGTAVMENHANHEAHFALESVEAMWNFSSPEPQPKEDISISIEVKDHQGKPIENFSISHEKKMHLIVVSKDLSFFHHIHPEYKGKGIFEITTQFPAAGEYKLISDFVPEEMGTVTKTHWITVAGEPDLPKPIQPDRTYTKVVRGKEVTLTFDQLLATEPLTLTFTFKDVQTNKPIINLQTYLGAVGHVVIMSADAELYLHNHPLEETATGPEAKFMTSFPKSGIYKIWGEFKHENSVFNVSFVVEVVQ